MRKTEWYRAALIVGGLFVSGLIGSYIAKYYTRQKPEPEIQRTEYIDTINYQEPNENLLEKEVEAFP